MLFVTYMIYEQVQVIMHFYILYFVCTNTCITMSTLTSLYTCTYQILFQTGIPWFTMQRDEFRVWIETLRCTRQDHVAGQLPSESLSLSCLCGLPWLWRLLKAFFLASTVIGKTIGCFIILNFKAFSGTFSIPKWLIATKQNLKLKSDTSTCLDITERYSI